MSSRARELARYWVAARCIVWLQVIHVLVAFCLPSFPLFIISCLLRFASTTAHGVHQPGSVKMIWVSLNTFSSWFLNLTKTFWQNWVGERAWGMCQWGWRGGRWGWGETLLWWSAKGQLLNLSVLKHCKLATVWLLFSEKMKCIALTQWRRREKGGYIIKYKLHN